MRPAITPITSAKARPARARTGFPSQAYPITYPKTAIKARKAAMSSRLFRLLRAMRSLKVPRSLPAICLVVGDRYGLALGTLGLEIFLLREAHSTGKNDGREALNLCIVGLDRVVVVLPGEGDLVLRRGKLFLKVDQNRVRAEIWVVLGNGEQVSDGPGEPRLGLGLLARRLGLHGLGAGLRDLGEHVLLLAEVLLHAFEEVGDQIVAALELHVYLPVRLLDLVTPPHEPVVSRDRVDHEYHDDHDDHDQ